LSGSTSNHGVILVHGS
jgi:hypothetical protein